MPFYPLHKHFTPHSFVNIIITVVYCPGAFVTAFKLSTVTNAVVRKTVPQLVEALSYKLEGSRFNSRWVHWDFSFTKSFRVAKRSWGRLSRKFDIAGELKVACA